MSEQNVPCPRCNGTGQSIASHVRYADGTGAYNVPMKCTDCGGSGAIAAERIEWQQLGEGLRRRRINAFMTLRAMAVKMNLSVVEVSYMEQGKTDPARLLAFWKERK